MLNFIIILFCISIYNILSVFITANGKKVCVVINRIVVRIGVYMCFFKKEEKCAFSGKKNQNKLLIHHNLRRLIETHITITNESFGVIREHFIIVAVLYMFNAFFRQPI